MSVGARASLVLVLALLAADAPVAAAQGAPLAGRLDVLRGGLVAGSTLEVQLGAGDVALTHLRERVTQRDLVDSLVIDGFHPGAPSGVGSPLVALEGDAARVELHDDARVPLLATLRAPAVLTLASGIAAIEDGRLVALRSGQGATLGFASGRLALDGDSISIQPGAFALVLRLPGESGDANARALAEAFATGALVATATADRGFLAQAGSLDATTKLAGDGATTDLPPGHRTALLAYDLPSAELVALLDGAPLPLLSSPADVLDAARSGRDAWSFTFADGRAFAIVSAVTGQRLDLVPPEKGTSSGGFRGEDGGRIAGQFVTGILAPGALRVDGFDVIATRAEVFRSIQLGDGDARLVSSADARRFVLQGSEGSITLVDEPDASLLLQATARAQASFGLAGGVHATARSPRVMQLDGAQGVAGELILLQDGAFSIDGDAVRAPLAPGDRVLYRAPAESFPSEPMLAAAIAGQRVSAHVALDAAGSASALSYSGQALGVPASEQGAVRILASGTIAIDASRADLPARSAHDVDVAIDGAPSREARSAAEVLAPGSGARHWTEIGANGSLRILVATGREGTADITIHAPGAQLGFRVFPDGSMLGRHTRLASDAAGLTNFTIDGRALLESATAGNAPLGAPSSGTLASEDAVWHVADGGALRLVANHSVNATLALAAGIVATSEGPGMLDLGGASLVLLGPGTLQAEGRDVRASLDAGSQLVLRVRSAIEREMDDASLLDAALAGGRLAQEIHVEGGDVASTQLTGDVEATARATQQRIDITLESAQHEGRVVLLTLAPGEMPALEQGNVDILVDGKTASEAKSLADALDADRAEYLVMAGDAGSIVVLAIPHFSVHTVTLQERAVGNSSPLLVYATIFLGALLAAETAILSVRRKKLTFIVSDKEK